MSIVVVSQAILCLVIRDCGSRHLGCVSEVLSGTHVLQVEHP